MRCLWIYIELLYLASQVFKSQCTSIKDDTAYSLLDNLKQVEWDAEDKPCLHDTIEMLNGVENSTLWATWIWDSMQRPSGVLYGSRYQLGNYDQCLKPPWLNSHPRLHTQYCLADVYLTDVTPTRSTRTIDPYDNTEIYLNIASNYGRHLNVITWGVCMSSRCSAQTVSKLVQAMLRTHHLSGVGTKHIKVHSCQLAGDTIQYGLGFKIFIWILLFLTVITLLSNIYLDFVESNSILTRLARSFSLKQNWDSLTTVKKDTVRVLEGIRFIGNSIVVVIHYFAFCLVFTNNGLDLDKDFMNKKLDNILRADLITDTFLVISGLLLAKGIVRYKELSIGGVVSRLWFRYVKMTAAQGILVFYFVCVSLYVGSGPLWPLVSNIESEDCVNNWWISLLMINNYVNPSNMCCTISWYIFCDYQLAVIGTILYYVYQKNKRVGLGCFITVFLISLLLPGLVTYWNQLPAVMFFDIEFLRNIKTNPMFTTTYIKSHHRACTYLIGMILGYIMAVYNPANYRNIIPKKWAFIGSVLALYILKCILSLGGFMVRREYDPLETSIYVAFNRIIWALATCCIIICCEYGTVPLISDYFNLQFIIPMGRLSYGIFIVHIPIIYRMIYSIRSPLTYDPTQLFIGGFGVFTASLLVSCLLWFVVEAPLVNMMIVLADFLSRKKIKRS